MTDTHPIQTIIRKKQPCFFISPHLDDAILSSGALLRFLSKKTSVTIITLFTTASEGPFTLSAKAFIKQCRYSCPDKLFAQRRKEDLEICRKLGVKTVHLNIPDALFRKKEAPSAIDRRLGQLFPEFLHVYPTYRFHITTGRISPYDRKTIKTVTQSLQALTSTNPAIFGPVGTGNHIDHVITREICANLFPQTIFWQDLPYAHTTKEDKTFIEKHKLSRLQWKVKKQEKNRLVKAYGTQIEAMFGTDVIPALNETYFLKTK